MSRWIVGALGAALLTALMLALLAQIHSPGGRVTGGLDQPVGAESGPGRSPAAQLPLAATSRKPNRPPTFPGGRAASSTGAPSPAPTPLAQPCASLPGLYPPTSERWGEGRFFGFSPEEWRDMAQRCELRWQLPPFGSTPELLTEEEAARFGMTPRSRELYNRILAQANQQFSDEMRALYREMTGDDRAAGSLLLRHVMDELRRNGGNAETLRRLALEQAGDAKPGSTLYERFLRLQLTIGDRLQAELNRQLGPDLARSLRENRGPKFTLTGCGSGGLFRSERMSD